MSIIDDCDLLGVLGLSEIDAADYLGKKRQTLNTAFLNIKKKGERVYFKTGELHTLISAAMTLSNEFNLHLVSKYIQETREESKGRDFTLRSLRAFNSIDLSKAKKMDLILPDYDKYKSSKPEADEAFKKQVKNFINIKNDLNLNTIEIRYFTDTVFDARIIEENFNIAQGSCKSSSGMEHYVPLILVYNHDSNMPVLYMITEQGFFVEAPQYRAKNISRCVEYLYRGAPTKSVFDVLPQQKEVDQQKTVSVGG